MRLLVRGFDSPYTYATLEEIASKLDLSYLHLLYDPAHFPDGRPQFRAPKHVEYHEDDIYQIKTARFPDDAVGSEPLDEAFIERMTPCESVVLRMADRVDAPLSHTYDFRKSMYLKQLRYWRHFLKHRKIDVFLIHVIPHHPVDYVIYSLCKEMGIRTLYFEKTPVVDTVFPVNDWETCGIQFGRRYSKLIASGMNGSRVTLDPRFEEQYLLQSDPKRRPQYLHVTDYFDNLKKERRLRNRLANASRRYFSAFKRNPAKKLAQFMSVDYWYGKKHSEFAKTQRLMQVYQSLVTEPDYAEPFIFVPLHYQPEATTSPMSGVFVEQLLMVQQLHAALPANWKLYVKEYSGQEAQGRSMEFYKDLAAISSVRFISTDVPSFDLIRSCKAVSTGTGSAGWEALFRGKPVLLFGHCYYQYAPGVFRVSSAAECQNAMQSIQSGAVPILDDMRVFLKAMEEECVLGFNEPLFAKISKITPEQNARHLAKAIMRELLHPLEGP